MRKTFLASAATALILAAGAASAQSISHDVQLEVLVETSCVFTVAEAQLNAQIDGFWIEDGSMATDSKAYSNSWLNIACNTGVPYTIETSASANGMLSLEGEATGGSIPARMFQGTDLTVPFGSLANSEEYAGVGNGEIQQVFYDIVFNDDGSGAMLPVPAVDTYSAVVAVTATF